MPSPNDDHDSTRWAAVLTRDARAEASFVYAVASTCIYCRPTCPSRRPRRDNVTFFADADAAERAGFRACLRCAPRDPVRETLAERTRATIDAMLSRDESPTLDALSRALGVGPHHLQRTFRRALGVSPKEYVKAHRLSRFKEGLRSGGSVASSAFGAGYSTGSRAYEAAKALGMTPGEYRRGGAGASIRYAITDSRFGKLLVAATERGACAIALGDREERLVETLTRELPSATLERAKDLDALAAAVVARLEGVDAKVAVDVAGTAFQRRVWRALERIPFGTTRTYREVAESIGRPTAARAVARACATNPLAIVVPCHRVIRGDGALGGYRWGLSRKEKLLAHERRGESPKAR